MSDSMIVTTDVEVSKMELIHQLVHNQDDSFEFIKDLDNEMSDWDFTYRLYRYFKAQMDKLEREDPAEHEAILENADESQFETDKA